MKEGRKGLLCLQLRLRKELVLSAAVRLSVATQRAPNCVHSTKEIRGTPGAEEEGEREKVFSLPQTENLEFFRPSDRTGLRPFVIRGMELLPNTTTHNKLRF